MEIRLEKPARVAKVKNLGGGFEVKTFRYTYDFFKGNHSMESKITENMG